MPLLRGGVLLWRLKSLLEPISALLEGLKHLLGCKAARGRLKSQLALNW